MKKGWLVVNAYLRSKKFMELYEYLIEAAENRNCALRVVTNEEILTMENLAENNRPDFAIFWDKDIKAAKLLEIQGIRLFNSARAVEICDDKALTYLALYKTKIKMPKTIVSPLTFGLRDEEKKFLNHAINVMGFPFVIKENYGSFGAQVSLARNKEEAEKIIEQIGEKGFVIQEYIESSRGRDIRIQMVGDVPVAAMLRENKNDFRANITNGGEMAPYTPTEEQVAMARAVCREIGLDFAGVDILFGENGEPCFCEVNSNAHFKNICDCTGVNVAEHIIEYVLKYMGERKSR